MAISEDFDVIDVTSLGGGLSMAKRRKANFTHDYATKILEMPTFDGDRAVRQSHVDYLANAMRRGTFRPEWVQLIVCTCKGITYRMNGQHTAWARLEVDQAYPCPVEVLEYEAVSQEDMRMLYATIDRGTPRTKQNVIHSYLSGHPLFDGLSATLGARLASGFSFWNWQSNNDRNKHDGDDVAYLLKTAHYDLALKVAGLVGNFGDKPHVLRAPVVAAMFTTVQKSPSAANDFWTPVATGAGMATEKDARLRLRNLLMQSSVAHGAGSGLKKSVSREYMHRACLVAWNAYREKRDLLNLKVVDETGKRPVAK